MLCMNPSMLSTGRGHHCLGQSSSSEACECPRRPFIHPVLTFGPPYRTQQAALEPQVSPRCCLSVRPQHHSLPFCLLGSECVGALNSGNVRSGQIIRSCRRPPPPADPLSEHGKLRTIGSCSTCVPRFDLGVGLRSSQMKNSTVVECPLRKDL